MNLDQGSERLAVHLHNELIGHLWLDGRRRFIFQYAPERNDKPEGLALSLSLPLRREPYTDDASRPFFANLLPEAEIRKVLARRLGVSERNDFILLKEIGGECAGAVALFPEGVFLLENPGYRALDEDELRKIVTDLPVKPFLAGETGIRLSLAGSQDKLPVYMKDDKVFLALGNAPSTHIIKSPIRNLEASVVNEAFCMTLAEKMGLPVAEATIRKNLDPLYVVRRFDREITPNGKVIRLHQEDFCQALGVLPDHKYESEGGPSLHRCFDLIARESIRPAADRMALVKWVIFNVMIGNADAHAKNLAILLAPPGPCLAPFYDLICTRIYENLSDRLAMKIGGENRPAWLQPRHWKGFADAVSVKPGLVMEILANMAAMLPLKAEATTAAFQATYGSDGVLEKILAFIHQMARKLA
jgi:serine/threonine-protein kinase HipA